MPEIGQIRARLVADTTEFNQDLKLSARQLEDFAAALRGMAEANRQAFAATDEVARRQRVSLYELAEHMQRAADDMVDTARDTAREIEKRGKEIQKTIEDTNESVSRLGDSFDRLGRAVRFGVGALVAGSASVLVFRSQMLQLNYEVDLAARSYRRLWGAMSDVHGLEALRRSNLPYDFGVVADVAARSGPGDQERRLKLAADVTAGIDGGESEFGAVAEALGSLERGDVAGGDILRRLGVDVAGDSAEAMLRSVTVAFNKFREGEEQLIGDSIRSWENYAQEVGATVTRPFYDAITDIAAAMAQWVSSDSTQRQLEGLVGVVTQINRNFANVAETLFASVQGSAQIAFEAGVSVLTTLNGIIEESQSTFALWGAGMQTTATVFGGLVRAAGPLLRVFESMHSVVGTLFGAFLMRKMYTWVGLAGLATKAGQKLSQGLNRLGVSYRQQAEGLTTFASKTAAAGKVLASGFVAGLKVAATGLRRLGRDLIWANKWLIALTVAFKLWGDRQLEAMEKQQRMNDVTADFNQLLSDQNRLLREQLALRVTGDRNAEPPGIEDAEFEVMSPTEYVSRWVGAGDAAFARNFMSTLTGTRDATAWDLLELDTSTHGVGELLAAHARRVGFTDISDEEAAQVYAQWGRGRSGPEFDNLGRILEYVIGTGQKGGPESVMIGKWMDLLGRLGFDKDESGVSIDIWQRLVGHEDVRGIRDFQESISTNLMQGIPDFVNQTLDALGDWGVEDAEGQLQGLLGFDDDRSLSDSIVSNVNLMDDNVEAARYWAELQAEINQHALDLAGTNEEIREIVQRTMFDLGMANQSWRLMLDSEHDMLWAVARTNDELRTRADIVRLIASGATSSIAAVAALGSYQNDYSRNLQALRDAAVGDENTPGARGLALTPFIERTLRDARTQGASYVESLPIKSVEEYTSTSIGSSPNPDVGLLSGGQQGFADYLRTRDLSKEFEGEAARQIVSMLSGIVPDIGDMLAAAGIDEEMLGGRSDPQIQQILQNAGIDPVFAQELLDAEWQDLVDTSDGLGRSFSRLDDIVSDTVDGMTILAEGYVFRRAMIGDTARTQGEGWERALSSYLTEPDMRYREAHLYENAEPPVVVVQVEDNRVVVKTSGNDDRVEVRERAVTPSAYGRPTVAW